MGLWFDISAGSETHLLLPAILPSCPLIVLFLPEPAFLLPYPHSCTSPPKTSTSAQFHWNGGLSSRCCRSWIQPPHLCAPTWHTPRRCKCIFISIFATLLSQHKDLTSAQEKVKIVPWNYYNVMECIDYIEHTWTNVQIPAWSPSLLVDIESSAVSTCRSYSIQWDSLPGKFG